MECTTGCIGGSSTKKDTGDGQSWKITPVAVGETIFQCNYSSSYTSNAHILTKFKL